MDSGLWKGWLLCAIVATIAGRPSAGVKEEMPVILSSPSRLLVLVGDTVVLPCRVDSIGRSVRVWKRARGGILFSGLIRVDGDQRISLVNGSSLQIELVVPEYADEYACEVSGHPDIRVLHRIQVQVPPSITMDPEDGHVIVRKGESALLRCQAAGYPEPVVTWTALTGALPGGVSHKQGTMLSIGSVEPQHSGSYECRAENGVGEPATAIFRISVLYAPEVLVKPEWAHGGGRATVELTCSSSAEPSATLHWTKRNKDPLSEDEYISIRAGTMPHAKHGPSRSQLVLKIQNMGQEHLGSYTCTANNSVGTTWKTVEVSGLAEPVSIRSNSSGDCETSFLLVWTVKSYTPVTEYLLRIRKHKDTGSWEEVPIPAMESHGHSFLHSQAYNVTGLQPATRYEAILQAKNNAGLNRPSDTFVFYTRGDASWEKAANVEGSQLPLYDADLDVTDSTLHTAGQEDKDATDGTSSQRTPSWALVVSFLFIWVLGHRELSSRSF